MGKEELLAEKVVAYLQDLHWDVYQEVKPKGFGGIADIVAVQSNRVWVIETKTTFSLAVIAQARRWKNFAHWVSVAVPSVRRSGSRTDIGCEILRHYGIGLIRVYDHYEGILAEDVKPRLARKALAGKILSSLCKEQKTYSKAGNNRSEYYSPFKRTCNEVARAVHANPGINLKSLIEKVDHHYASASSARNSLRYWAETGKIRGIRMERDGKFIKFFPSKEVAAHG
jgi:hypothetical protein